MAKLKGRDISVWVEIDGGDKELVALARDADIDVSCDIAEFTSPLSGRGKRNRAGRYSWRVNIGTLIDDSDQPVRLLELLKNGSALVMIMDADLLTGTSVGNKCTLEGTVVPQQWKIGAPLQGLATFNASFIGDGELRIVPKKNVVPSPR